MIAGKIGAYDLLFSLRWSFSGEQATEANAVINGADLSSKYATSLSSWKLGVALSITANTAGPGSPYPTAKTKLAFTFDGTPTVYTLSDSYLASGSVSVEIINARFYSKGAGGGWLLKFDTLTLTGPDGVLDTITDGESLSPYFAPCGIPLIGFPCLLDCSGGSAIAPIVGAAPIYDTTFDSSQTAVSSATGGWQLRPHGAVTYQSLPVDLSFQTAPACPSYAPDPGCPSPSASDTGNATVTANYSILTHAIAHTETTVTFSRNSCSVMLIPNLEKKVNRMNDYGYAALIYRAKLPRAAAVVGSSNTILSGSGAPCGQTDQIALNPAEDEILAVEGQTPGPLEDVLDKSSFAIYSSSGLSWKADSGGRAEMLTRTSAFNGILDDDWTGNIFQPLEFEPPPSLDVQGLEGKYLNTWCAPHWSMWPYFPPDSEVDESAWPLDGVPEPPSSYWIPIRSQYLHNIFLPPNQNRHTRTDLCTACLGSVSPGLWPSGGAWGISNFQVHTVEEPSFVYSSSQSGLFSATNATLIFGTQVTVTPTSEGACSVSISLQSFSSAPYFLPALINHIGLSASGPGLVSATASLIGQDGSAMLLGSILGLLAHQFFPWTFMPHLPNPTKYLGSWGQDFGSGATLLDVGSDDLTSGESLTAMSDPAQNAVSQILNSRTAKELRLDFTTSDVSPFTLIYPGISSRAPEEFLSETGMSGAFLTASGPGVRVGQWNWTPGGSVSSSPLVYPLGKKQNVADGLATKHALFIGDDPVAGTNADLAALYDSTEGNTIADVKHGTLCHYTAVPDYSVILVNGLAEAPPCASLPTLAKDAATIQPTDTFGQESWDYACEPRFLIYPDSVTDLFQPGSPEDQWTGPSSKTISGWVVREHSHPVSNAEDATFHVEKQSVQFGTLSPWHGYFWVGGMASARSPCIYCDRWGSWHHAYPSDAGIVYEASAPSGTDWLYSVTAIPGSGWTSVRIAMHPVGRIDLVAVNNGADMTAGSYRFYSEDWGKTWTNGEQAKLAAIQADVKISSSGTTIEMHATPDSGTAGPGSFSSMVRYAGDTAFRAPFTPKTSAGDDLRHDGSGFGTDFSFDGADRFILTMVADGDSAPSVWWSADEAATWTRF